MAKVRAREPGPEARVRLRARAKSRGLGLSPEAWLGLRKGRDNLGEPVAALEIPYQPG